MTLRFKENGDVDYEPLYDEMDKIFLENEYGYSTSARVLLHMIPELLNHTNKENLRKHFSFLHKKGILGPDKLVTTREKLDSDGNVTSTTLSRRKEEKIPLVEGKIKKRVQNPYGADWITWDYESTISVKELEDSFDKILTKHVKGKSKVFKKNKKKTDKALTVTITDEHVGMDVNTSNLFTFHYDKKEYESSISKVYNSIIGSYETHGRFDVIYLDNLGDAQDGFNGQTSRGGHDLPQNMTNGEVFSTCLDNRLSLIEGLLSKGITDKIVCRVVVNDNHSADFGLCMAIALKNIVNRLYQRSIVEIDILHKFIEYRYYGDHCFVLTHGKDKEQMKFGLPYYLNEKTINYINNYLDFYDIKSKYIHVHKGDLHQVGYDPRPMRFDYRNFGSFAPPSNWVQHNFGPSRSSYSLQVVPKGSNEISHTDYFLDYKRKL